MDSYVRYNGQTSWSWCPFHTLNKCTFVYIDSEKILKKDVEYVSGILTDREMANLYYDENKKCWRGSKTFLEPRRIHDEYYPSIKEEPFLCAAKNFLHKLELALWDEQPLKRVWVNYYFELPFSIEIIFCTEKMYKECVKKSGTEAAENAGDYNSDDTLITLSPSVRKYIQKIVKKKTMASSAEQIRLKLEELIKASDKIHLAKDFSMPLSSEYD